MPHRLPPIEFQTFPVGSATFLPTRLPLTDASRRQARSMKELFNSLIKLKRSVALKMFELRLEPGSLVYEHSNEIRERLV